MTKLEIITKALERNPDVIVFGPKEKRSFGEGYNQGLEHNSHTICYVVAPKVKKDSVSELNKWFKGLIPDYLSLQPVNNEEFRLHDSGRNLKVGHLRFDENGLGYAETLITRVERVTDKDFLKDIDGFRDGLRIRTEHTKVNLGRMILLYGCQDEETAKKVLESGGTMYVPAIKLCE